MQHAWHYVVICMSPLDSVAPKDFIDATALAVSGKLYSLHIDLNALRQSTEGTTGKIMLCLTAQSRHNYT